MLLLAELIVPYAQYKQCWISLAAQVTKATLTQHVRAALQAIRLLESI